MRAGLLRHRAELQSPSENKSSRGDAHTVWAAVVTVWCALTPTSGGEDTLAGQVTANVTHTVVMRYRSDIGPRWRLKMLRDGRVLEIVAVVNVDERDRELRLSCREIV